MFYFKLHRLKVQRRREFFGKAEIQLISFAVTDINGSGASVPLIDSMVDEMKIIPIEKIKNNQEISFEPEGLLLSESDEIPNTLHWRMLILEIDAQDRDFANALKSHMVEKKQGLIQKGLSLARSATATGIISELTGTAMDTVLQILSKDKDDQVGLYISSFTNLKDRLSESLRWKDVVDTTGNTIADISMHAR